MEAELRSSPAEPSFPARLGLLLADPLRGLARVAERKTGAVRDALALVLIASVAYRLPELIRAGRSFSRVSVAAALTQIVGVIGSELRTAAFVALVSALVVVVLAGRGRRDPSLGLEMGAACYVQYFFAWAPVRLLDLDAWFGYVPQGLGAIVRVLAWLWVLALVAISVRVLRRATPLPSSSSRRGLFTGLAVLALPVIGLAMSSVWSARNYAVLRPLGRADLAPDFALSRIDGHPGQVRLSSLRGHPVLLDFWATWCPPCLALMPTLHDLYRDWQPRGVEFVGINSDGPAGTVDDVREFVAHNKFPYPVVIDDRNAGGTYGVSSIPYIVIVGRDGKIVRVFIGAVGREQLDRALTAATE